MFLYNVRFYFDIDVVVYFIDITDGSFVAGDIDGVSYTSIGGGT